MFFRSPSPPSVRDSSFTLPSIDDLLEGRFDLKRRPPLEPLPLPSQSLSPYDDSRWYPSSPGDREWLDPPSPLSDRFNADHTLDARALSAEMLPISPADAPSFTESPQVSSSDTLPGLSAAASSSSNSPTKVAPMVLEIHIHLH
ncbi:hypothetical protein DFQ27_002255 [Actinomortierella ambigua]|uniref:Uncharacterized protein n=1 Tax=Actinomortierella ambigua TaxID=1343610 RepID=A0A9P6U7I6_9FUNG|nr:hypothetical protein DFQ27_002255 [Actinomortierella ambigua]